MCFCHQRHVAYFYVCLFPSYIFQKGEKLKDEKENLKNSFNIFDSKFCLLYWQNLLMSFVLKRKRKTMWFDLNKYIFEMDIEIFPASTLNSTWNRNNLELCCCCYWVFRKRSGDLFVRRLDGVSYRGYDCDVKNLFEQNTVL